MKSVDERLEALFRNEEFLKKVSDKGTMEDLYAAVSTEISDISQEALERYLIAASRAAGDEKEISEDELDDVSGGATFKPILKVIRVSRQTDPRLPGLQPVIPPVKTR